MTRSGWIRLAIIGGAVALLEASCRLGLVSRHAVIPPSEMARGAFRALGAEDVRGDVLATLLTVAQSFVLAIVAGFALGVLLHRLPRLRRALDPFLASYYAVPTFVFYPVFIVLFGLNRWPLVAIGFIFAVVAVAINTLDGLSRVPRAFLRTAQVMRLSGRQTLLRVILPAAAPWLFTGAKFAVAYSFIGVIAGEFVHAGRHTSGPIGLPESNSSFTPAAPAPSTTSSPGVSNPAARNGSGFASSPTTASPSYTYRNVL